MSDDEAAGRGGQRGGKAAVPPCLAVVVGRGDDAGQVFRVDAPDRVLRIWALLGNAADDLREASLPSEVIARLRRQLDSAVAELETSLSPALAGELHRLIGPGQNAEPSADELRVEYATVLAWTASLLTEVLSQIHDAAARTAWGRGTSGTRLMTKDSGRARLGGAP
jgi:proteasome activator-like protein